MDVIELTGMEFYGYHGCFPEERKRGQRFLVDLRLSMSLKKAGESDDLETTVNSGEVFEEVRSLVEGKPLRLIEAVAEGIAQKLLLRYPLIRSLRVTVHKPDAPLPGKFRDVAVTVERER